MSVGEAFSNFVLELLSRLDVDWNTALIKPKAEGAFIKYCVNQSPRLVGRY